MFVTLKSRQWLLVLLLLPVCSHWIKDILEMSVFTPAPNTPELATKNLFWLLDFTTYLLLPLGCLGFYVYQGWLKWTQFDFKWRDLRFNLMLALLLAVGLWIVFFLKAAFIQDFLQSIHPSRSSFTQFVYTPSESKFLYGLMIVYFALSAAIVEEVVYRSFLIRGLERFGFGTAAAVAVSVALFISVHITSGATFMFNALVAGTLFGYIYVKTRNILPLVVAHFLLDFSWVSGFDQQLFEWLWPLVR